MAAQSLRRDSHGAVRVVSDVAELRRDLVAEQDSLDDVVGSLHADQWTRATASPGWSVFDQIAHLAYFDNRASIAIRDPERFRSDLDAMLARMADESIDEITLGPTRSLSPTDLLKRWRDNRRTLDDAAGELTNESRIAWFGPSMGGESF